MPCSDSSSSMVIKLDGDGLFKSFEYAKITCGQEIKTDSHSLNKYYEGKDLRIITESNFQDLVKALGVNKEEDQFILYMEWDALRCAVGLYSGLETDEIDTSRCVISSVEHSDNDSEIVLVILPPKEMPKALPCSLNQ